MPRILTWKRCVTAGTLVAGLTTCLTGLGAGAAYAGTNGQQLEFVDTLHDVVNVCVTGPNQSGNPAHHCFATPYAYNFFNGFSA